jgi:hypothetical protein
VKRKIHGSAHRSRTEAFLHWVEENPTEIWPILEAEADKALRELEREHFRLAKTTSTSARRRARADELAEAVPF